MFKTLTKKGFSLVELLVVITIIVILSVVAYTALGGQTAKARNARRVQDLGTIQSALEIYYAENNRYPDPKDQAADTKWGNDGAEPPAFKFSFTNNGIEGKEVDTPNGDGGGVLTISNPGNDYDGYTVERGIINHDTMKAILPKLPADPTYEKLVDKADGVKIVDKFGLGNYIYAVLKTSGGKPVAYQLAATLENEGNSTAYIIGNYDDSGTGVPKGLICVDDDLPANNQLTSTDSCIEDGNTNIAYEVEI